jgi:hypothetical protein
MLSGGSLTLIGYMLSPLSWWNDAFVNIPLALAFACVVAMFYKPALAPAFVVGYWLTNVAGFVLMHKGGQKLLSETEKRYSWKALGRDVIISFLYTALIIALIKMKVLEPLEKALPTLK